MESNLQVVKGLLIEGINSVIEYMKQAGYVNEFPECQRVIEYMKPDPEHPGCSSSFEETIQVNSFLNVLDKHYVNVERLDSIKKLNDEAQAFAQNHGKDLDHLNRPYAIVMITQYFTLIDKFRVCDQTIEIVLEEFVSDITRENETFEMVYFVDHFDAERDFSILGGNIAFSKITRDDLAEYAVKKHMPADFVKARGINSNGWLCKCYMTGVKKGIDFVNSLHERFDNVLNALFLTIAGSASFLLLRQKSTHPYLVVGEMSSIEPRKSGSGSSIYLDNASIARFESILVNINKIQSDDTYQHLRLALRRMRSISSRYHPEDHFVDIAIALESLLAHDGGVEATYRFKLRGACILDGAFGSAKDRLNLLKDIYNIRSKIVHGSEPKKDIRKFTPKAENVLRSVFLWYLDHLKIPPKKIVEIIDEQMASARPPEN